MIEVAADETGTLRVAPVKILLSKAFRTRGAIGVARERGTGFGYEADPFYHYPGGEAALAQAARIDYDGKSWEEVAVEIGLLEVNQFGFLQGVRA